MALLFGALADDLTGGMELAAMLVAHGVRCGFVTRPEALAEIGDDFDAVVIARKTRVVPAADAVAAFEAGARALLERGARQLFFKYCATFDSTDDGNIGPAPTCCASSRARSSPPSAPRSPRPAAACSRATCSPTRC